MKYFLLLFLSFSCLTLFSQEDSIPPTKKLDSSFVMKSERGRTKEKVQDTIGITIKDYKIISFARDTTFLDTSLTINKEYKYNYLRQDDFELMPFANVGQPYNKLGVNFENKVFYPLIGARAKNLNYWEVEDIRYYNVPTPMSDLFFKTTFEQGQTLDALLAFNTSRRLNFSLGYKGFRSLGKYLREQAESGNFTVTSNYVTKNGKYQFRAHIAAQNIIGQENGGLNDKELQFESGDEQFKDRSRIDVVFSNGQNKILGKRYFLDHQYNFLKKKKDSVSTGSTSLAVGHQFNYETKYYQYQYKPETSLLHIYGEYFLNPINDKASLKTMHNQVNILFSNKTLGSLKGRLENYSYNYFFNSILITDSVQIENKLKGEEMLIGGDYSKEIGGFALNGSITQNVTGSLTGTIINASMGYTFNEKNKIKIAIHSSSKMPNYNFLLYQSDYLNYNWQNTSSFNKQKINSLQFNLESGLWGNLAAKYSKIDNYTYFTSLATDEEIDAGSEKAFIKPFQENSTIDYIKIKYKKEFRLGKFALNNTLMYQNVSQTNTVLNVPELVTRNTLYYSNDVFKKAMYLQTGVTFKYFTPYNMDAYNPVLGEFYIQNRDELGGYPLLDFFINAKIRQTRVYLKAEHFNTIFSKEYNYYSAPNYPYRDFVIRFGLVWNFFS
ncbi:hypothetical protein GGR42_003348 [Saonia flava]|uniref:Porin n=1 Tax=Saonia flava TaxID=523696 RepID=A0A846R113_9FLAO|nr:putative porin [Saonia flava]NJB72850.1 hypothetical protein [Saonia flava]